MRIGLIAVCLFGLVVVASADDASLSAPDQAVAGSTVEINWIGPGQNYDSVYILKPGAPDSASGITSSSILSKKNPIGLVMPDEPGEFEIRYWSRAQKQVLARRSVTLVDVPTSLKAPERAKIGSSIDINWTSSGNSYDLIGLYPADAEHNAAALSTATVLRRNPVVIKVPEAAGEYELRYVTRMNKRILARQPVSVFGVDTAIDAPDQANSGETIEVGWQGPGNQYDKVALFAVDAPDDAKAVAVGSIVSGRNPVSVRLPEQSGEYEWRYMTASANIILARRPFRIVEVLTELSAPEHALASSPIYVGWQGPGNDYDQIQVVDPNTEAVEVLATSAILGRRNPVPVNLPDVDGTYQLRYVTTQTGQVLATRQIVIQPAGRLAVVYESISDVGTIAPTGSGAVELILDASGSMLQRIDSGMRRIEIAKEVLEKIVREFLPDEQPFALRVFGHKEANSCRTDLEVPLSKLDRDGASKLIADVNAMNLAKTPIADSLAKVPTDLAKASGRKTIVLITDGEETCDGDPATVIEALRSESRDIQLSIVGFAIDDESLKADFENWAALGGGSYFDAQSADELLQSLRTVISGPFHVLNNTGEIVGEGIIGGADIVLPSGTYRVEMAGDPSHGIDDVIVKPRELTKAAF